MGCLSLSRFLLENSKFSQELGLLKYSNTFNEERSEKKKQMSKITRERRVFLNAEILFASQSMCATDIDARRIIYKRWKKHAII